MITVGFMMRVMGLLITRRNEVTVVRYVLE